MTVVVVTALLVGIYYMHTGVMPGARVVQEGGMAGDVDENTVKLMFFYTTWCPHCHKAQPEWASLKQVKRTYGGKKVMFEEIDCDADKGKAAMYQIKGYPTIKLETPDKVYQMDGPPTVPAMRAFMTSALGEEKTA